MADNLTLSQVREAVESSAAAFRARTRLQPAGGPGDKVFPPTFAGATYQIEHRRLPNRVEPVPCVVLDTVQSQANRMEEALLHAAEANSIQIPIVATDFSNADLLDPVTRVTSLEAPHRIADAIFRDSEVDGSKFRRSEQGRGLDGASMRNATPLYRLCPTALVFGLWDSAGPKGGLGVRFERALVAEVVGIAIPPEELTATHMHRGLRRGPLGIRKSVRIRGDRTNWEVADEDEDKTVRPSEIVHGSIPFDSENAGVTFEYAEQTITLSLIALRRLRFPQSGAAGDSAVDRAAQTVLATLGLCAATLAFESGMNLRSRCVLWPEEQLRWELLARPGETPREFLLDGEHAAELLRDAVHIAEETGLSWLKEPLVLTPSEQLVRLVRRSQEAAVNEGPGEA